eukprot:2220268-Rhodomonas_salina.1
MDTADADLMMEVIRAIGQCTAVTNLYKLKSHRGEPFNTRVDALADKGVKSSRVAVARTSRERIRYRTPTYNGVWCTKVQRWAESQAAEVFTQLPGLLKGVLDNFLLASGMGRRYLGDWWRRQSGMTDADFLCAIQIL